MSKRIKTTLVVGLVVVIAFVIATYINSNSNIKNLNDDEIRAKYCHVTADIRETDIYCQNPDIYRQHVQQNRVIENQ